jgi:hypothetical protein
MHGLTIVSQHDNRFTISGRLARGKQRRRVQTAKTDASSNFAIRRHIPYNRQKMFSTTNPKDREVRHNV